MPLTKASDVEAQSRPNEGNGLPNILYSQPWWHGLSSNDTSQEIAVGCAAKASDGHLFTDTYHLEVNVEKASRADAENEAHGTMASGDVVQNGRQAEQQVKKVPTAMPAQEHPQSSSHSQMEHVGYSTVRSSYPFQDPSYGGVMAPYATQINPHLYAMHQRVPLPLPLEEEPVYVNAKQYHGILRRRQSRARAELEKKAIKSRKPYLHESRHQHALRRPRGSGGRFLNTKKLNSDSADSASRENPNPNLTLPTTFSGAMDTKSTVDSHEGNSSSCNQHEAKGSSISKLHNAATRLNNNGSGYNLGSAYHSSSMNSENIDSYGQGGMKVNVTSSGAVSVI